MLASATMPDFRHARLFFLLALATVTTAQGERIELRARPIVLDGGNRTAQDQAQDQARHQVGALTLRAGFVLDSPSRAFGGLSGLDISCHDGRLVAVSDKGHYLTARLVLAPDDTLLGLANPHLEPLLDTDGRPVEGRGRRDAEEIVAWGEGLLVSFEGDHRLALYGGPGSHEPTGSPRVVESPPGLEKADENKGLEALAGLTDGRLLVIAEGLYDGPGTLAAWLGGPGAWQGLHFVVTEDFEPTAAATLPGGDVLVLERSYNAVTNLTRARLSLLPFSALIAGTRLEPRELARLQPPQEVDNMEGLAVCPTRDGAAILVYLVSDDNFSDQQRTLLLQFELPAKLLSTPP